MPGSPSPDSLTRLPVSTPGGSLTLRVFSRSMYFLPLHSGHGSVMRLPVPRQAPQVRLMEKKPCCMRVWPVPLHDGQTLGWVPGLLPVPEHVEQGSVLGIFIV